MRGGKARAIRRFGAVSLSGGAVGEDIARQTITFAG